MRTLEQNIDIFIEQQLPTFYTNDRSKNGGPLFIEFLREYYKWLHSTDEIGYKTRKLLEYGDIDLTTDDLLEKLKNKYIADLPSDTIADKRLLIKNALDFYRNKGNEKSYDILFRALFDKDVTIYLPGRDMLKLSDGEWDVPQYIEVSNVPDMQNYVNKKIVGIGSGASAIVENYYQIVVNRKNIDILVLSNVNGFFDRGEYIRLSTSTNIENLPKILGSLSGVSVIDGGANFNIGDTVDIIGDGRSGKGRVIQTYSADGRVNFSLIFSGTGYSRSTIPVIYPRVILSLETANSNIQEGQLLYQTDNVANGIVYTNSFGDVTIKEISSGFVIGRNIKTALRMQVSKLANNVNNFNVGEVISQYDGITKTANGIISNIEDNTSNTFIFVTDVQGSFSTSEYSGSTPNKVIVTSNTNVNCFIYEIFGGSNTGSGVIADISGGGTGASFRIGNIFDTEFVTINNNYLRDILSYSVYSFDGSSNTSNVVIGALLDYELSEIGKIQYINSIVPGTGYSLNPFVELNNYPVSSLQIEDTGGIKGNNAIVESDAGIANGIVSSVAIIDSGYGYEPGKYVTMQKDGSAFAITGRTLVLNQGKSIGQWKSTKGFLNSDMKIQDSKYYQEYSYELQSDVNYHRYNDIVRKLVHPIGTQMFGKFLLTTTVVDDDSEIISTEIELAGNGTISCNTSSNTIVGNGTFFSTFFSNNDIIKINSYQRTVTSIANNTYLTIDIPVSNTYVANTYSKIKTD